MAEKRPDQLPAVTGMSESDIFIIQKNIADPDIANRTVGQIFKKDVGFVATTGGSITGPLNLAGDLIPATSGTFNLGSSAKPWLTGYFEAGTIELGPISLKAHAGGLIVENGNGSLAHVSGHSGIFKSVEVDGQLIVPDSTSEEVFQYSVASGESYKDLTFTHTHSSIPMALGNMILGPDTENFYAINFTNLTLSGCRVIYSSTVSETGNSAHILIKKT